MDDLTTLLATTVDPAQQKAVGRAFLLLIVLIIVGVLVVLGLLMAGFAWFAKNNTEIPERKDRFEGVNAWEESARRAEPEPDDLGDDPEAHEDWEADDDEV